MAPSGNDCAAMTGTPLVASGGDSPRGRMVQIADLIKELQAIHDQWGNTCVYIRDMSWGSVALNRKADDDKRAAKLVSLEGSDTDDPDIYGH